MRAPLVPSFLIAACCFGCMVRSESGPPLPPPPPERTAAANKKAEATTVTASDEQAFESKLRGDSSGDASGKGGLGLSGVGEGGGGTADGGIGLGKVGTLGHGAGTGTGQGYGSGAGKLGGGGSGSRGRVAAATATTAGAGLPPEIIQRIIRANVEQIRFCYEAALTKTPALAGKVAVSFTIDGQGKVASASAGDTTISDAEMVTCVISAVKRMSFPLPDGGGAVNVTYPFAFSPGDS
jgi:hypothetical protein